MQIIKNKNIEDQAIIILLPQNGPKNQPQVEWTDIDSFWQWEIAQYRLAEVNIQNLQLKGRFFRACTEKQTFAVLQWYAWDNVGDPSLLQWFIVDQKAQWQRQRAAWVAVSILLPMEPRGQVEQYWDEMRTLEQQVQTALLQKLSVANESLTGIKMKHCLPWHIRLN